VTTLILPPRYTEDSIALRNAAFDMDWEVERLHGWRVPENLNTATRELVLYGEPLFASVVADGLGLALLAPPPDWLAHVPPEYLGRKVRYTTLADARTLAARYFVKPAEDKVFLAGVYQNGAALPNEHLVAGTTPVLVADPVEWTVEYRCFILERQIATFSVYLRNGELAQDAAGNWTSDPTEQAAMIDYVNLILGDKKLELPAASVLDVGIIAGQGWHIIETNSAWGSGIYGCDPAQVLRVVRRANLPKNTVTDEDKVWLFSYAQEN
jgi:hypothetical protein